MCPHILCHTLPFVHLCYFLARCADGPARRDLSAARRHGASPMNTGDQGKQKHRPLMPRPRSKRRFTGRLLKPIDLREAKARGLRAQFALPPDESDRRAHFRDEVAARLPELKKFLGLPPDDRDPERLAKALVERELGIPRDAANWVHRFAAYLTWDRVPGFRSGKKGHGAPRNWDPEQLMQLFADVNFRVTAQVGWHQTVRRERINSSGSCMSVLRIFQLCFLAVESTDRMTTKSSALSWARNPPEIFCRSFIMRASASAWLLVKGTLGSCRNRNTSLLR